MTLVAASTTSPPTTTLGETLELDEWALTRSDAFEHLVAIELVLTHDFDEPSRASTPGLGGEMAQRVREEFLLQATGVAQGSFTRRDPAAPLLADAALKAA